ncbi:MAG: hypothetical protein ABJN69_12135 [Hellea sp.]
MKRVILTVTAALALTACATGPSAYGPSDGRSMGFENTQIEKDRFRIAYTGRTEGEARDFALLRAAEIAIAEGYTHFKVLGGNTSSNGGGAPVSSRIGVGIGSGGYGFGRGRGARTNVNLGIGVHDVARAMQGSQVTESIEVILKSSGSSDPSVYDAKSVQNSIRPQNFK